MRRLILLLTVMLALAAGLAGPTAAQSPSPGPAADKILYSSDAPGRFQLHVMDVDGSSQHQVVETAGDTFENALTCDGQIATVHEPPGTTFHSLWTVNLDGSGLRQVTFGNGDHMPTWRPDGGKIAFSSHRGSRTNIFLVDPDGANETRVTSARTNEYWPHWSPDAGLWAVQYGNLGGTSDIFTVTPDGSRYTRVTDTGDAKEPHWGPGGREIAYARRVSFGDSDIWAVDVTTGAARAVVTGGTYDHQPTWLPDGSRIIFTRGRESSDGADIWSVRPDGTDLVNLTNTPNTREMWPATACLSPEAPTPTPTRRPTSTPTATVTPRPSPTPVPTLSGCVCDIVLQRVPWVVINDALANPEQYHAWRQLLNPAKPPGPDNPRRECLTLQNVNLDYHPLWNKPHWRVGCP